MRLTIAALLSADFAVIAVRYTGPVLLIKRLHDEIMASGGRHRSCTDLLIEGFLQHRFPTVRGQATVMRSVCFLAWCCASPRFRVNPSHTFDSCCFFACFECLYLLRSTS
jgi:hypothetical protein